VAAEVGCGVRTLNEWERTNTDYRIALYEAGAKLRGQARAAVAARMAALTEKAMVRFEELFGESWADLPGAAKVRLCHDYLEWVEGGGEGKTTVNKTLNVTRTVDLDKYRGRAAIARGGETVIYEASVIDAETPVDAAISDEETSGDAEDFDVSDAEREGQVPVGQSVP